MSQAMPLDFLERSKRYIKSNPGLIFTPAQLRRIKHKQRRENGPMYRDRKRGAKCLPTRRRAEAIAERRGHLDPRLAEVLAEIDRHAAAALVRRGGRAA